MLPFDYFERKSSSISEQKNQELKMKTNNYTSPFIKGRYTSTHLPQKTMETCKQNISRLGISVKESRELGEVGHGCQLAAGTSSRAVHKAIPKSDSPADKCTKPKNQLACHRLASNNRHLRSPEVQTQHVWSKTSCVLRAP